jgi:hypothetical protein
MLYSGGGTGASTTSRTTFDDGTDGVYYDYDAREGVRPSRGPSSAPPYALSYPYAPAYRDAPVSPDTRRQLTSELDDENLAKALSMSLIEADAQKLARQKLEQENALVAQMSFDEANARAIPYSSLRDSSKYEEDEEDEKNLAIAQVASLQDSHLTTYGVAEPRYIAPGFRKKASQRPGPSSLLPADVAPSEVPLTLDDIDHTIMSDPATDRSRRNKGKNPLFRRTAGIRRSRKMRKSKRRRRKTRRKTRRTH